MKNKAGLIVTLVYIALGTFLFFDARNCRGFMCDIAINLATAPLSQLKENLYVTTPIFRDYNLYILFIVINALILYFISLITRKILHWFDSKKQDNTADQAEKKGIPSWLKYILALFIFLTLTIVIFYLFFQFVTLNT